MALPLQIQAGNNISSQNSDTGNNKNHSSNVGLWGEFDNQIQNNEDMGRKRVSVNLTQVERDLLARLPRPLPLEGPRIHQPGSAMSSSLLGNTNTQKLQGSSTSYIVPCDDIQQRDPYISGGITLLNYATELRRVLNQIEERHALTTNAGKSNSLPKIELPTTPVQLTSPLPPLTFTSRGPFQQFSSAADRDCRRSNGILNIERCKPFDINIQPNRNTEIKEECFQTASCSSKEPSKSTNEHYKINHPIIRNVLRKSVAAITAFEGYDMAVDAALDLLTDAAAHYMKKLCLTLRSNRDKQLLNCEAKDKVENDTVIVADQGFSDVMDRTFREIGNFGDGLKDVPEYYSHSVVGRYQGIVSQCRQLLRECHHQATLDAAYPNMASASSGSSSNLQNSIQLPTGVPQILAGSNTPRIENILEQQNLVPEIHLPSSNEDILGSDGPIYVGGTGPSSILGAVLSGPQSQTINTVHSLVHPSGTISLARTPTAITSVAGNNVPTFSLDHNTPQIETGLQMLQSLEQGGHFAVSASVSHDGSSEDHDQSPAPMLSGIIGASPVLEVQSQSNPNTQGSLLLKTSTIGTKLKIADKVATVSISSQNRKRRRTPEDPLS